MSILLNFLSSDCDCVGHMRSFAFLRLLSPSWVVGTEYKSSDDVMVEEIYCSLKH